MSNEPENRLAKFQVALLNLLSQPLTPEQLAQRLRTDEAFLPHQDYVETFEPRMLEVAASLVKKWGKQGEAPRDAGTGVGYTPPCDIDLENS